MKRTETIPLRGQGETKAAENQNAGMNRKNDGKKNRSVLKEPAFGFEEASQVGKKGQN